MVMQYKYIQFAIIKIIFNTYYVKIIILQLAWNKRCAHMLGEAHLA